MSAAGSFVGKIFFEKGNHVFGDTPEDWDRIAEVHAIGGIGETNDLVNATTFASEDNYEYIGGLADGATITLELNYKRQNDNIQALIQEVKDKSSSAYRFVIGESAATDKEEYSFLGIAISWSLNPSVEDRNTFTFVVKVSGEIEYKEL